MSPINLPKVLIVDDEQYVRDALTRDLRGHFECLVIEDYKGAEEVLRRDQDIDIALVDESLASSETGGDLLRLCQREFPIVVRCLISGDMEFESITKALGESLFHRFFFKPWDPQKLVLQLKECLFLRRAFKESLIDPLTGVLNRRGFNIQMEREMDRSRRYARPLTLVVCDVDKFKEVNDQFGHTTGDELLKGVGSILIETVRSVDYVARIGGDEFALILPDTSLVTARVVTERIRGLSSSRLLRPVSLGVAEFTDPKEKLGSLLSRADLKMYEHKTSPSRPVTGPK